MKYTAKLTNILERYFIPPHDKLKHHYMGTMAFAILAFLNMAFGEFFPVLPFYGWSLIVIAFTVVWEILQKKEGGTNDGVEIANDIFYSNISHIIISLTLLALEYYSEI